MVLKAFLDDSGDGRNASVVLAGSVADRDAWAGIESKWSEILKDSGISYFRMTDCLTGHGPFKDWEKVARKRLISKLVDVVTEGAKASQIALVSAACILPSDRRRDYIRDDLTIPYLRCVDDVFLACSKHRGRVSQSESLELVFAEHSKYDAATLKAFKAFRASKDSNFLSISFALQRSVPGLQLADLVAHQVHQRYEDRDRSTEWWKRLNAASREGYCFETHYTGATNILPSYFDFGKEDYERDMGGNE